MFEVLGDARVDGVMHLAARALIDESIRDPAVFFAANVVGGLNLLDAMVKAGTHRIVFSSTAACYGEPERVPIAESARLEPINPYGESKLAFERILPWYERAYGIHYVGLRYFNAAGATERFGEYHVPETHLVPIVLEAALGRRDHVKIFGFDYDTEDGTCVRDYVHVSDIAQGHIRALERVDQIREGIYNMGNGNGYSNLEVVEAVERATDRKVEVIEAPRRPGDPARLVASSDRIRNDLGWEPQISELDRIVASAWAWRSQRPEGYAS